MFKLDTLTPSRCSNSTNTNWHKVANRLDAHEFIIDVQIWHTSIDKKTNILDTH
jgi:hypothetical protein